MINNINSKCIKSGVHIYRNIDRVKSCELCWWYSGPLLETQPIKYYVKTEECKGCIQSWAAGVEEVWRQRSSTRRWNWSTNHSDMLESSPSHHQGLSEKTMFICRRQIHMSGWLIAVYDDIDSPFIWLPYCSWWHNTEPCWRSFLWSTIGNILGWIRNFKQSCCESLNNLCICKLLPLLLQHQFLCIQ